MTDLERLDDGQPRNRGHWVEVIAPGAADTGEPITVDTGFEVLRETWDRTTRPNTRTIEAVRVLGPRRPTTPPGGNAA